MSLFDAVLGTFAPSPWWLADLALRSTLLLSAFFLLLRILRRRSAALRALVGAMGLGALLALPLLMILAPGGLALLPSIARLMTASAASAWPPPAPISPFWLAPVLALWVAGTAGLSLRTLLAARRLEDFFRFATVPDASLRRLARRTLGRASRSINVKISDEIDVPVTFGLFRPRILLPADADSWSADRLEMVLLHEGAHVVRRDLLGHSLGIAACSLFWWQPLVWRLARRAELEREHAADDRVLSRRLDAAAYARQLLAIAERLDPHATPAYGLPMARPSQLRARLGALLDHNIDRRRPATIQAVGLAVVTAATLILISAVAPAGSAAHPGAGEPSVPTGMQAGHSTRMTPPGHASGVHPESMSGHAASHSSSRPAERSSGHRSHRP